MKINELYSFCNYIRRKDPIGGSISIPEFNTLCKIVAFQFFKKIMGLPEQYQKGARDPIMGYGLNAISEEKIRPLKALPTSLNIDVNGFSDYPVDYFRHGPCYYTYTNLGVARNISIPFVNDAKFSERINTVLDPPSLTDPVGNLHSVKLRFLPITLSGQTVKLEYIKLPTEPVMGYVIDDSTAENIYVDKGAYCQILTAGNAGDTITLQSSTTVFGSYTVSAGDTPEDIMIGLVNDINQDTLSHNVQAIYDGDKVVLIDLNLAYTTLTTIPVGGITLNKSNFTTWSIQFDWQNDIEAMTEISEMLLDKMGISNRDMNIVQWSEKEKAS